MSKEKREWLTNLATNVKLHRKELSLSQQALAEKARLSVATIAKIEASSIENATLDTIEALGTALNLKSSLDLLKK